MVASLCGLPGATPVDKLLLGNRLDERLAVGAAHRALFARRKRLRGGQSFHLAHLAQSANAASAARVPRPRSHNLLPFRHAADATLAGGLHPQLRQFRLGALRDGVAVGLLVGKHQPGDHRKLPRAGHDGHVATLLAQQAAEEVAQRPRVLVQVLRRFDEHPPRLRVALLGDRPMVAAVGRLLRRGRQAQVAGRVIGVREAANVAPGGHNRLGRGHVNARQRYEQLHLRAVVPAACQFQVDRVDLALHEGQQASVGIDQRLPLLVEFHIVEPLKAGRSEQSLRRLDKPHGQHAVDAVAHGRAMPDQRSAPAGEFAETAGGFVGLPDLGQEVAAEQLGQYVGVDLVGLHLRLGDGLRGHRVGDHHAGHVRPEQVGHGPAVGRGLQGHMVARPEDLRSEQAEDMAVQGEPLAVDDIAGLVDDARLDNALVDIEADKAYHGIGHGRFSLAGARPRARPQRTPEGAPSERRRKLGLRVRVRFPRDRAERHLPLRARSSTGWAGGALRYDGGLEAHTLSRAAPKCSGPSVLPFCACRNQRMVSLRQHFVPNPVSFTHTRFRTKCNPPLFIHTRYDAANRRTGITYPDGSVVARSYTARDQLAQIDYNSSMVATFAYDAGSRRTSRVLGDTPGTQTTWTYGRQDDLPTAISSDIAGASFSYTYDANKNKLTEGISAPMADYGFSSTSYDSADRLTAWNRTDGNLDQAWNLSLVGDWATFTENQVQELRTHTAVHEIATIDATSIVHDATGNLTRNASDTLDRYTWDFDNRLATADVDQDGTAECGYQYDALGRRVSRTIPDGEGSATTVFVGTIQELEYSPHAMQVVAEYAADAVAASPERKFVYAEYIDEPVMMVDETALGSTGAGIEEAYYYHQNSLYSVAAITDATGTVVERYAYSAYGGPLFLDANANLLNPQATTIGNPYLFTGRRLDEETTLYYYRARMYDAELGRFVGRDPIGYAGSEWNLYEYVKSSATILVDPSGHSTTGAIGIGVSVAALATTRTVRPCTPVDDTSCELKCRQQEPVKPYTKMKCKNSKCKFVEVLITPLPNGGTRIVETPRCSCLYEDRCSKREHGEMQAKVEAACKGKKKGKHCVPEMSKAELLKNAYRFLACKLRRDEINLKCFAYSHDGHLVAASNTMKAHTWCMELYSKKK